MRLTDRQLGYLVLFGIPLGLLLFLGFIGSIYYSSPITSKQLSPISPPNQSSPTPAPPAIPPEVKAYLARHPDQLKLAASTIAKMQKAGLVDYYINPDGLFTHVYIEPKLWESLLHKDKIDFVNLFIVFFLDYNIKHPDSKQISIFSILNMSTRDTLARAYLTPTDFGRITILK